LSWSLTYLSKPHPSDNSFIQVISKYASLAKFIDQSGLQITQIGFTESKSLHSLCSGQLKKISTQKA